MQILHRFPSGVSADTAQTVQMIYSRTHVQTSRAAYSYTRAADLATSEQAAHKNGVLMGSCDAAHDECCEVRRPKLGITVLIP